MGSKIVIGSILKEDKRRYNRRKTFITGSRMEETLPKCSLSGWSGRGDI
jgi:hypothetical protein